MTDNNVDEIKHTSVQINPKDIELEVIRIARQLLIESNEPFHYDIRLESSLQKNLGIDSLGRAELFQRIEKKFAVSLPDSLLAEAETLKDIYQYLCEHPSHADSIGNKSHSQAITDIIDHGAQPILDLDSARTLLDVLFMYAKETPDKPHVYFQHEDGTEEIITYGKLLHSSLLIAGGLKKIGVNQGETVAIMLPSHPTFFYSFFGVLLAGAIPVPVYPPFRAHMLETYAKTEAHIFRNANVRTLIIFKQVEKVGQLLKAFVPDLKNVVTADDLINAGVTAQPIPAEPNHYAFIQYTSGSTSNPKGVLLNHQILITNIRAYGKAVNITHNDVTVSWLPLYHDMGLIGMWFGSFYHGCPLVLMTPFSFLNHPEKWLWAIHRYRATLSGGPNFAYELCVRKVTPDLIEGIDLSSWRLAANGAEKVYPRTLEAFATKFAPYGFKRESLLPVYGLAESTVGLAIPPSGVAFHVDRIDREKFEKEQICVPSQSESALEFVGCGKALPQHEIRIVDEDNQMLPDRHVGKLQFRGPSSMLGYYNNPHATKAVYHQGWWDSGDLAYLVDGEVYITGRYKDLIIKAGRNLYAVEMEELVGIIPGIRQGSVIAFGHVDEVRGTEQVIIVAETREKNTEKRAELVSAIKETISNTLDVAPDHVLLVPPRTVPKTSSGKLQRAACKKMYLENTLYKQAKPAWLQVMTLGGQWIWYKIKNTIGRAAEFIYTTYFFSIFCITLLPVWTVIRFSKPALGRKVIRLWAKFLCIASLCYVKKTGIANLTKYTPVIYAANHASYVDIVVSLALVPSNTLVVGKKELLQAPVLGSLMRHLEYFAVDRMNSLQGIEDTKRISMALSEGYSLFIFPEGTFTYAPGLRPFRLGTFKMASEMNVPICPIAFRGTRTVWRGDEKTIRIAKVSVTICEPIHPSGTKWVDIIHLRQKVRDEITQHCGEPTLEFLDAELFTDKPNHE